MTKKAVALLPEGKLFDLVYSEAIAPAAAEANVTVARLSVDVSSESVRAALRATLQNADFVIADLTGRSGNAMYATGFAQAMDRKVLFVVQHFEDCPFDPKAHAIIAYGGDRQFLRGELRAHFVSEKSGRKPGPTSSDSARERFLSTFGDILAKHGYDHRGEISMENPETFVLLNQEMELALVQELARRARELGLRLKLM